MLICKSFKKIFIPSCIEKGDIYKHNKFKLIQRAGQIYHIDRIYAQLKGIDVEYATQILKITCTRSNIPEPIRVAHLIASGVAVGESKGKA